MRPFSQRVVGAALLDVSLYEEVEADTTATSQAMTVVILSSVATGLGVNYSQGLSGLALGSVAALVRLADLGGPDLLHRNPAFSHAVDGQFVGRTPANDGLRHGPGDPQDTGRDSRAWFADLFRGEHLDAGRVRDRGPAGSGLYQYLACGGGLPHGLVGQQHRRDTPAGLFRQLISPIRPFSVFPEAQDALLPSADPFEGRSRSSMTALPAEIR